MLKKVPLDRQLEIVRNLLSQDSETAKKPPND